MPVYICGESALEYFRANRYPSEDTDVEPEALHLEGSIANSSSLSYVSYSGLCLPEPCAKTPLHVLVPEVESRGRSVGVHASVCSRRLPKGSLVKASSFAYVVSPERLYLEMARKLTLVELIELGMELCGTYRLANYSYDTRYDTPTLTTRTKLALYVKRAGDAPGVKRAREALKYVIDNSASPMETVVYLLLCLPRRLGGYAFPTPKLNVPVRIGPKGKHFTPRTVSRPDLFWRDKKVDLEYHGSTHEEVESRAEDSMRRKALESMGYRVFELTYAEVEDPELFRSNVRSLAKALGVRVRAHSENDFARREAELRKLLLEDRNRRQSTEEDSFWGRIQRNQVNGDEILETLGLSELPSEYDSWEDFLDGFVSIDD